MLLSTTIGILIPFIGTSLGAAMVFVLKDKMSEKLQKRVSLRQVSWSLRLSGVY